MSKPKFSLKTLLWLMLLVAAFFAGRASLTPQLAEQRAECNQLRDQLRAAQQTLDKVTQYAQSFRAQTEAASKRAE